MANGIKIRFDDDESLVFYDWLASQDFLSYPVVPDEATLKILWGIESIFESKLVVTFLPEYKDELKKAKDRIVAEGALKNQ